MDREWVEQWAQGQFSEADLGHEARRKRGAQFVAQMMSAPSASIPKFTMRKAATKAAYRFLENEEVTHEGVLSGHIAHTMRQCSGLARVLIIQDTMSASFGGRAARSGLGPVNDAEGIWGCLVHTALAVELTPTHRRVLGVLHQHVWARSMEKKPRDETSAERKRRSRESERWPDAQRDIDEGFQSLGLVAPHLVLTTDREGDIFELFEELDQLEHSFVIRAQHDRLVVSNSKDERTYSLERVRSAPILATKTVSVPARGPGHPARTAHLVVRATTVEVKPPRNRDRKGAPVRMNIVLAEEVEPPSDKAAVRWYLLTREPIETAAQVLEVTRIYETRWLIEEFHMGLKTGCSLEERQMETAQPLLNFLALATIVACKLLQLRDVAREPDPAPASSILTPTQILLLREVYPRLPQDVTSAQALRAIAALGGFYDSSKKVAPGWRTLTAGYVRLLEREEGYLAALRALSPTSAYKTGE